MTEVAVQSALGERLRAIRQLRRKTLKSVATAAGISESFLSQLERGRTNATIATLQRLSTARVVVTQPKRFTPLAFPLLVDRTRNKVSSEKLGDRIKRMQLALERAAG